MVDDEDNVARRAFARDESRLAGGAPRAEEGTRGARRARSAADAASTARKTKTNEQPNHWVALRALSGFRNTEYTVEKIFRVVVTVVRTRTSKLVMV